MGKIRKKSCNDIRKSSCKIRKCIHEIINVKPTPEVTRVEREKTVTKNAEKKARAMLSRLSTERLIKEFDMTEDMPASFELSMVRGWIMDELEKRDPTVYDKWLDMDYPTNKALRELYLGDQALQTAETK